MDRGKTGVGRAVKSKIAQHPSDLFVLGSKNSRNENSDSKSRQGVHTKSSSSSATSSM